MSKHVFKIEDGSVRPHRHRPRGHRRLHGDDRRLRRVHLSDHQRCVDGVAERDAGDGAGDMVRPGGDRPPGRRHLATRLEISYLQDPDLVDGLSRFLFEHDADVAWFFMGLAGDNPPKAVGKVRLTSGAIGGEGRVTLTADATLPCDGKPIVCFGDDDDLGVGRWRHRPRRHRGDRRQPGFVHADRCRPARQPRRAQRGRDHGVAGDGVDDRAARRARRRHPRPLGRHRPVGHRERAVMADDQRQSTRWPPASTTFPADLVGDAIRVFTVIAERNGGTMIAASTS